MNPSKVTRRFYGFESVLESMPGFAKLRQVRSIADLQGYAGYVWAREMGRGKCPVVLPRDHKDHSWYDYEKKEVLLARAHRNLGGLLHELAHALGVFDKLAHGPAFTKRCLRLYREYGEWDGRVTWEKT